MSDVFRILAEIQLQVAGKPELDKLDAQIKNVTADQKTIHQQFLILHRTKTGKMLVNSQNTKKKKKYYLNAELSGK